MVVFMPFVPNVIKKGPGLRRNWKSGWNVLPTQVQVIKQDSIASLGASKNNRCPGEFRLP